MPRKPAPKVWNMRNRPNIPGDAVNVGRPTKWGNPFKMGTRSRADVIAHYRYWLCETEAGRAVASAAKSELRGKHLACWCAPLPCHADVLLELANADEA